MLLLLLLLLALSQPRSQEGPHPRPQMVIDVHMQRALEERQVMEVVDRPLDALQPRVLILGEVIVSSVGGFA
ncbi:hypothetical protein BO82DRAFT_353616 [Aspergillus uvarum CBS 121591]|uniref:Uncharacterized protein n=1 Tax=Aspergillus uvarum CBS 121591 TaxID=1448315 RepID=A0A319CAY2_9EURO|nr:hypothetical protein BO82DRAFT_353616 [Aspergillus uvarum CBS 121591]PYH82655.1 hypothetical protein BO82DRAFT_353616 [Aspergillus uvarum CBS 121591]